MAISTWFIERPDRDLAPDGLVGGRRRGLSAAAGRAAAGGRSADASRSGAAAGRQPADHGLVGHPAAGAPVRRDRRRHADDLGQHARHRAPSPCSSTSSRTTDSAALDVQTAINAAPASCRPTSPRRRPIARSIRPIRRSWCWGCTSDVLPLTAGGRFRRAWSSRN